MALLLRPVLRLVLTDRLHCLVAAAVAVADLVADNKDAVAVASDGCSFRCCCWGSLVVRSSVDRHYPRVVHADSYLRCLGPWLGLDGHSVEVRNCWQVVRTLAEPRPGRKTVARKRGEMRWARSCSNIGHESPVAAHTCAHEHPQVVVVGSCAHEVVGRPRRDQGVLQEQAVRDVAHFPAGHKDQAEPTHHSDHGTDFDDHGSDFDIYNHSTDVAARHSGHRNQAGNEPLALGSSPSVVEVHTSLARDSFRCVSS